MNKQVSPAVAAKRLAYLKHLAYLRHQELVMQTLVQDAALRRN